MDLLSVRVRYFGATLEMAGKGDEELTLVAPATVGDLLSGAEKKHPRLKSLHGAIRIAVGEEVIGLESALQGGETAIFLPPVAGG